MHVTTSIRPLDASYYTNTLNIPQHSHDDKILAIHWPDEGRELYPALHPLVQTFAALGTIHLLQFNEIFLAPNALHSSWAVYALYYTVSYRVLDKPQVYLLSTKCTTVLARSHPVLYCSSISISQREKLGKIWQSSGGFMDVETADMCQICGPNCRLG